MFTLPETMVPFTFLDSSSILRGRGNAGLFPRRNTSLDQIKCGDCAKLVQNDLDYYEQIMHLYYSGTCSAIITMEAINPMIPSDDAQILRLFGSIDNYKSLVCRDEDISPFVFNKAIILITRAKCVIADEVFFSLKIGETLKRIIMDLCPLYTLSNAIQSRISNSLVLEYTPKEFIQIITEQIITEQK